MMTILILDYPHENLQIQLLRYTCYNYTTEGYTKERKEIQTIIYYLIWRKTLNQAKILKIHLKPKLQYCGTIFQCSIDQTNKIFNESHPDISGWFIYEKLTTRTIKILFAPRCIIDHQTVQENPYKLWAR